MLTHLGCWVQAAAASVKKEADVADWGEKESISSARLSNTEIEVSVLS